MSFVGLREKAVVLEPLTTLTGHTDIIRGIVYVPGLELLVSASLDKYVNIRANLGTAMYMSMVICPFPAVRCSLC